MSSPGRACEKDVHLRVLYIVKENGSSEVPTCKSHTIPIETILLLSFVCLGVLPNNIEMCWLYNWEKPECKTMSFMIPVILQTKL